MTPPLPPARDDTPADWRRHLARAVRRVEDLPSGPAFDAARAAAGLGLGPGPDGLRPLVITPYYLSLIDPADPADPIARLALPRAEEWTRREELPADPIEEERRSPLPGLIRRYPDRALLLVHGACAVNCRHCTRRILGQGGVRPVAGAELDRALCWIAKRPEIRDVILSGGDPLLLEDDELLAIIDRVRAIPTVEIVRVATRVLAALPMRVDRRLAAALAARGPLYVNTQFDHPRELTGEAARAVAALVDAGIPVANQAVLLRGVNDDPEVIEELCRALLRLRVRPYYLFVCDLVRGTAHLRTSLERGLEIMARLRGRLSGLGIPQLVVDLPGGLGKIPLCPEHVVRREPGRVILRAPDGTLVDWPEP
jgi:lysine 2,3-aminomutase